MSRLPPVPPAGMPVHGPEGVAKTSVDISHRVRHQAQREAARLGDMAEDARGLVALRPDRSAWVLVAAVTALGLGYLAGRRVV